MAQPVTSASPSGEDLFVPDLCRVRSVLLIVITTQLVVLLFALVRTSQHWIDWDYVGLVSLFAQWTVLTSAALICLLRRPLARCPIPVATVLILALVMIDVLIFTLLAQIFLQAGSPGLSPDWHAISRNLVVAAVITLMVLRYFYLQYRWQQEKQAQMEARLAALQARIQPHFLFNSMNTIASLIASDPEQAEEAVLDLSALFRANLRSSDDRLIPLEDEITLCRQYLALEALRLGDRLAITWDIEPGANQQLLPPLSLQPLVENAIYHGIQPRPEGGTIAVKIWQRPEWTYVMISNPLPEAVSGGHQGHRMAMANIRARLAAAYERPALLKTSHQEGIFTVTLRLPRDTDQGSS